MKTEGLVQSLVFIGAAAVAPLAEADVVTSWNTAALNAIRAERTPPPRASRAFAILHVSMFDAVNGIDRSYEPYFIRESLRGGASEDAAASAAAHKVLVSLFPAGADVFDELHAATLAGIRDNSRRSRGVEWGEYVADQILAWRANDNSDALVPAPVGAGPGVWLPTPPAFAAFLLPQWGHIVPFAMPGGGHFRPLGPPGLDSATYTEDYAEVQQLGALVGSARTPEQDQIAHFWADGVGTETPPGHWNSIAQHVAAARRNSLVENARLFALLNVAMADAAISAWDAKYTFNFWRPVTAIRQGDMDGNPATVGDPSWSSFILTPPFPDYVSGHSTFSGAASRILARFYRTDRVAFTTGSDFLPGVTRRFESFSAAAAEAAISRLYAGIHFRFANEDGLAAGREIGEWTFENYMQPKGNRGRHGPRDDTDDRVKERHRDR